MDLETRKRLHEQLRELGATTQRETAEVLDIVAAEFDAAMAAERERIAKLWDDRVYMATPELAVDIGQSIRRGELTGWKVYRA